MKVYYLIWVDSILAFKKNHPGKDWKLRVFSIITFVNGLNFWSVISLFKIFEVPTFMDNIPVAHGSRAFLGLVFFVQYVLVFVIINYVLVFYNNNYERLIRKYQSKNGRLALAYCLSSLVISFGIACIFSFPEEFEIGTSFTLYSIC
jgi:hypothetical protein